jgi:hypothetical protein
VSISYFILEKGIIEREDLSIYEKMCCVVLAKWAAEEREGFDTLTLAREMSCTERKATETIRQLKQKGFIQSEGPSEVSSTPRVIKAENVEGLKPISFDEDDQSDKALSREDLMAGVQDIIDETINDSEARIILNFAGDDLEKIKRCYKIAKNMQISDTIEALIIELQRKEKPPATLETINREVKIEESQKQVQAKVPVDFGTQVKENNQIQKNSESTYFRESVEVEPLGDTFNTADLLEEIKMPDLASLNNIAEEQFIQPTYTKEPANQAFEQSVESAGTTEHVGRAENFEHIKNVEHVESTKRPWYLDDDDDLDDVIKTPSTQINANMINKMKAYKRYGK